ncbi:hypothetical protein L6Q96_21615 [Candidatus Binatia bacterium]|nr:hypothetical protein [Candidatus Binatia bacterium]
MARSIRRSEIARRRQRRQKLLKLRKKFTKARTEGERKFVLSKVVLVAPTVTAEQFAELMRARSAAE